MNEFLVNNGYKHWDSESERIGDYSFVTQKFQKRVDRQTAWLGMWLCECNDKLLVNVEVTTTNVGDESRTSWTASLCHQSPVNNEWCDLKIYGIPVDKVVDIEKFESKLRNMWIAFNKE